MAPQALFYTEGARRRDCAPVSSLAVIWGLASHLGLVGSETANLFTVSESGSLRSQGWGWGLAELKCNLPQWRFMQSLRRAL